MARRRSRGRSFRLLGYNVGGLVGSMKQPTATGSVTDSVQPKNIMGAVPVIGGVIANSMLTSFFAKYIPMTKKGAGNYALGLGTAGILGGLAGFVNADVAKGVLLGGVVETVGRLIADLRKGGVGALSLGGIDGEDDDLSGLGSGQSVPAEELSGLNDFVTPGAIQRAIPSESTMTQYSLPAASAPARMHEAYQRKVLAEMIGDGEE